MADIPREIWFHIASFVPEEKLCHLLAVNKVFFDVAMGLRWTEVRILARNTSEAMHLLKRLRDPFVVRRLRRLLIDLTHVEERHSAGSQENNISNSRGLRRQVYLHVNRVFKVFEKEAADPGEGGGGGAGGAGGAEADPECQRPTVSQVIDAIIEATPQFVNVNYLNIDSSYLPPSYSLIGLCSAFWTSFGANLRCLSLVGNLERYRLLIELQPKLERLTELCVRFENNLFREDLEADSMILLDIVAPFINNFNSHLVKLIICSWASLDLSAFFDRLEVLPRLEHLDIHMTYNKALHDPSGLARLFTEGSEKLQKLALKPASEEPLSQWLSLCIADTRCFANLRFLDIYPTSQLAGIDILASCIQRSSRTMEHLTVRDRYLRHPEAVLVVNALSACQSLVYLKLNVWRMDVALLDVLADNVPWLEQLALSVEYIGGTLMLSGNEDGEVLQSVQKNFCQELANRRYVNWKLKDISIWWYYYDEVDRDTMLALGRCIPSINSFFGTGHMHGGSSVISRESR